MECDERACRWSEYKDSETAFSKCVEELSAEELPFCQTAKTIPQKLTT